MDIIRQMGNLKLMTKHKTAFLCSRRVPDGAYALMCDWVDGLTVGEACVICGNHSPVEQSVCARLLRRRIPLILALAETFPLVWPEEMEAAFREQRLLAVTLCRENVHRVTARSAFDRNELMLSLADDVVVGYCAAGGNVESQVSGLGNVNYLVY